MQQSALALHSHSIPKYYILFYLWFCACIRTAPAKNSTDALLHIVVVDTGATIRHSHLHVNIGEYVSLCVCVR